VTTQARSRAASTPEEQWLRADEFAELAGISLQAARRALRSGANGGSWRGHRIAVRHRLGRGGRSGVAYEVALQSLPETIGPAGEDSVELISELASSGGPRRTVDDQTASISDRWATIREALKHPRQSSERSGALCSAAKDTGVTKRTLYRWTQQYEAHGVRGLARARPRNAGRPRVVVSRKFDGPFLAAGHSEAALQEIASTVHVSLKGLWASRAERAGGNEIRRMAEFLLLEACEARGLIVDRSAVRLSRRSVERFAQYRVVNQRRNDRKAFDDAKPRIRREWTALAPMERIVADVKHLDVIVTRPDGSTAWPKIVGFMDAGTGRVFVHPVLLEHGDGVRQEHVIEGFLAMVSDPLWGFPQGLYLDNGSEFGALTKIDSALQLINEPGARTIVYARPYNASAKPIESLFARLDRYVFSMMPGYAGPNRLAKKTQTVGRPPRPYPESWQAFCADLQGLIGAYNNRPVGGPWRGRSPNEWLNEKVAAGWRSSQVEPLSLDAAFSDHDTRRVDRGVVSIRGQRFAHPALTALPSRTVVDLALPWRRGAPPLARIPEIGWVCLSRDVAFPARWIEGARESRRRQQGQSRYVAGLAKDAPSIDPVATAIRRSERMTEERNVAAGAKLDLGSQLGELGAAIRAGGRPLANAPPTAEDRRLQAMALTERLERKQHRDQ
jgi:hypothetical protein